MHVILCRDLPGEFVFTAPQHEKPSSDLQLKIESSSDEQSRSSVYHGDLQQKTWITQLGAPRFLLQVTMIHRRSCDPIRLLRSSNTLEDLGSDMEKIPPFQHLVICTSGFDTGTTNVSIILIL